MINQTLASPIANGMGRLYLRRAEMSRQFSS